MTGCKGNGQRQVQPSLPVCQLLCNEPFQDLREWRRARREPLGDLFFCSHLHAEEIHQAPGPGERYCPAPVAPVDYLEEIPAVVVIQGVRCGKPVVLPQGFVEVPPGSACLFDRAPVHRFRRIPAAFRKDKIVPRPGRQAKR